MRASDFEREFTEPLRELGVDLIEVEFKKEGPRKVLRFYIDSQKGITLQDCETVSRYVSDELDKTDPIDEAYYLEVTSLGLDRAMKKDAELKNAVGKEVVLKFYGTVDQKKEVVGVLEDFSEAFFRLRVEDETREYARDSVSTIRKYVQW